MAILRSLRQESMIQLLEVRHRAKRVYLVMDLASMGYLRGYSMLQGGPGEDEFKPHFSQSCFSMGGNQVAGGLCPVQLLHAAMSCQPSPEEAPGMTIS